MLNSLELLGVDRDESIQPFIRPVSYIPGSKSIQDLLYELRQDGDSMAVVVDEFGGAEGLITIEDIVEEVVEEIGDEYDKHDEEKDMVKKISAGDYIVNARIELDDFQEELGIELPDGNYTTLAGYLLELAKDIPKVGDIIDWGTISFTIMKATPQAIQEVRVRW